MDDKKNKIKLSAPSQFKPTRKAGGLTSASTTDPSRQLKTPSAFLQPQNETRKIPGKLSPRTLKRGSLDGQQLFVHEEVKKLEEQNRRLEQNITRQLQDIAANATQLKKSGGPIRQESPELKRVTALYEELCKEQRRNFEIQSSMQKQMEKQAAVIEKQTEQIACLQSESGNENERLRRKVQRLTEELKETKSYYEKEIEGKEKAQLTNLAELSKLKEQMYDLNVNYKKEVDSLGRELEQQKIDNRSLVKRMRTQQNEKEEIITQFNESRKNERQKFEVDFKQISDKLLEDQNALNNKISALSLSQKEKDNIISGLQSDFEKKENENNNLQLLLKQKGKDLSDLYHKVEQLTMENTHLSEQSQKMLKDKELNHKMLTEEKESQFNAKLVEIDKIRVGLQEQVNQVTAESETAAKTIEELRKYIGNKLSDSQLQRLEEEIQRVKSENEQLKETCKVLESTNELLNVRLSSLSNVLHIQETEMSRNDIYLDGEKASVLLKKWREKVYALLVQLKAQEISENEELRKLRQKLKDTQSTLNDVQVQNEIFLNQLTEKKAELQIRENAMRVVELELQAALSKQEQIEEICSSYEENFARVYGGLQELYGMVLEKGKKFDTALSTIQALGGRVDFANNRLKFIAGQFKRKEEQWKEKLANAQENEQDVVSEFEDSGPNDLSHLQPISRRDLLKEVNRLTTERQLLQYQLRVDSDEVQKKITNIKFEFESKLKLRDEMIEELQISLKENQFHKDKLEDDLEQRTKELKETCECLETLKTDLGKARKDAEEEFSGNLDQERQAFQEQFAKMEKVVDEARREHTKSIISLRQIEKKLEWEKQKTVDTLSRQEEEYECKIRKLSDKIILLEKERNLLLTTVRQEGLKLPREKPLPLDTSLEESEVERVNVDLTRKGKKVKRKKPPKSKSNDITNLQGNSGHSDTLLYHKNDTKDLTKVLRDLTSMCASIQRNEQEQDEEVPASSTSAEF